MSKFIVSFGEVMMRLTAPDFQRFTQAEHWDLHYGGAEANVSISLHHMGMPAQHVTRFPDHDLGKAAQQYLMSQGVASAHTSFGEGRLGLYFMENGAMQRSPKIIYDRFDSAFSKIELGAIDWKSILKEASWFHWTGITPALSQGAADVCLEAINTANELGVPVSGDINYRRNLWQYGKRADEIMPALFAGSQYIVAGPEDFRNCLGIQADDFEQACILVKQSFPNVKKIAFTYREVVHATHNKLSGVLWDGKVFQSPNFDMPSIIDRIGGGDAFMAGLIFGWLKGWQDQQVVDYATAASVFKHSVVGDANVASQEEIENLLSGKNAGKLLR